MQDFIRKVKLLSVGLFYMGKEKVEESVAELIKKGEITEKEGRALVNELVVKSKAGDEGPGGAHPQGDIRRPGQAPRPAEKRDRRAQEEDREARERGRPPRKRGA